MKMVIIRDVLSLAFLLVIGCQTAWTQELPPTAESPPQSSKRAEPKRLTLNATAVPRELAGNPCLASVTLTNCSDEWIQTSLQSGGIRDLRVVVVNEQGVRLEKTRYGKNELAPDGGIDANAVSLVELCPRSGRLEWQVDLAKCFELPPGKYAATFEHVLYDTARVEFQIISYAHCSGAPSARVDEAVKRRIRHEADAQRQARNSNQRVNLEASVNKRNLAGNPCIAQVSLFNRTDDWTFISRQSGIRDLRAVVYDAHGDRVAKTDIGERRLAVELEGDFSGVTLIELAPSSSTSKWEVDLAECFELPPGKYVATFESPFSADLPCVEFQIVPQQCD
ncbi:hypothetical protein [Blastopirellula marina]|uniref:Intracellular proteinase inhibitor BsuPI domain-containing protein n=1 Tax=Blastopirellula marina TaxID=124 RepID=A0A2S8F3B5_9BACT|nr:hypothetical protein [Blastopirellula marina]PQO26662.1 hypothetical protein C5Y98_30245 [Blastopirellula marina]PTL40973.1 hypothetical protein C5Y97_30260 [Blastopirellula marina]